MGNARDNKWWRRAGGQGEGQEGGPVETCTGCGRLFSSLELVAIGDDLLCAECRMEAEGCGCED